MANILDPLIQRIQGFSKSTIVEISSDDAIRCKIKWGTEVGNFKSLRRNRSSNDKLLNYDMRRKTRRVFAGEVVKR